MQKRGNSRNEWEDSYHVDPVGGLVAVSDGAGEGIFCRQWAALLTERYARELPDLRNAAAYHSWLESCRSAWLEMIDYPKTRITQRLKIDNLGAAATFLGFRLEAIPTTPGAYVWRAEAAGDSCLLWVRDAQLVATFPLTRGPQFKQAPLLLRTKRIVQPLFAQASGTCRTGDLFLLATDAVSHWLIDEHIRGPADWSRFESIEQAVWEEEIERLRDRNLIVNDDCTLIAVRVGPRPAPLPAIEEITPEAIDSVT